MCFKRIIYGVSTVIQSGFQMKWSPKRETPLGRKINIIKQNAESRGGDSTWKESRGGDSTWKEEEIPLGRKIVTSGDD